VEQKQPMDINGTMRKPHIILSELQKNGDLEILVKSGICSTCVLRNIEVYYYVDSQLKTGVKKTKAVLNTETQFNICRQTVYNILNTFK
jgi:Fe-S cluster biogenesis protein NfuA